MKKLSIIAVCVIIVLSLAFGLVACNKNKPEPAPAPVEKTLVLTIGDSIAEAIAGPSPMSERENYGYYSLLGKGNDFTFINRAISGYKTDQLLDLISVNEDVGGPIDYSLLKNADIIQLSILGNDLLQQNLGVLLCDLGNYKLDIEKSLGRTITVAELADYVRKDTTGQIEAPSTALDGYVKSILYTNKGSLQGGMGVFRDNSTYNYAKTIERIKEVNPDALLICQTIYNPVFDTAILVANDKVKVDENNQIITNDAGQSIVDESGKSVRTILKENYDWEPSQYREIADILIELLNNVVRDYLTAHPGAFELVEIHDAFEAVCQEELKTNPDTPYARRLYSQDYVHPSNEGHALIATLTQ
ncbi:MAG: SGNH/GDSL hydrolase family protein, partial [Clostridia bacterium]|nr:SGNH/GDSL hydrolase family protein [Clostridia bacterium]